MQPGSHSPPSLFLREDELKYGVELILRAQRALEDTAGSALGEAGLGRAHYRALLLIAQNPGLSISELKQFLRIRKQSLAPVLDELVERGLVEYRRADEDRRRRLLSLTDSGAALERRLFATMRERMAAAYRRAGAVAVGGFWQVLAELMDDGGKKME